MKWEIFRNRRSKSQIQNYANTYVNGYVYSILTKKRKTVCFPVNQNQKHTTNQRHNIYVVA